MANLSLQAIITGKKLSGNARLLRDGIIAFCATKNPTTDRTLLEIAEFLEMSKSAATRALAELQAENQVYYDKTGKRFFLLQLDEYQLIAIQKERPKLLRELAEYGCAGAQKILDRNATEVAFLSTFVFALHLHLSQLELQKAQLEAVEIATRVAENATALKDLKGENGFKKKESKDEDDREAPEAPAALVVVGANPKPSIEVFLRRHVQPKLFPPNPKNPASVDQNEWLSYLQKLPESRNFDVFGHWRRFVEVVSEKDNKFTKERFLRWLHRDLDWENLIEKNSEVTQNEIVLRSGGQNGTNGQKPASEHERRNLRALDRKQFNKGAKEYLKSRGLRAGDSDDHHSADLLGNGKGED